MLIPRRGPFLGGLELRDVDRTLVLRRVSRPRDDGRGVSFRFGLLSVFLPLDLDLPRLSKFLAPFQVARKTSFWAVK